jgi:glucose dehydrogenase
MTLYHEVKRTATRAAGTALLLNLLWMRLAAQTTTPNLDWPSYGNDLGAMRFVNVDQINRSNVASLP